MLRLVAIGEGTLRLPPEACALPDSDAAGGALDAYVEASLSVDEEVAANANREPLALSAPPIQEAAPVAPSAERQPAPVEPPPGEDENLF